MCASNKLNRYFERLTLLLRSNSDILEQILRCAAHDSLDPDVQKARSLCIEEKKQNSDRITFVEQWLYFANQATLDDKNNIAKQAKMLDEAILNAETQKYQLLQLLESFTE